jgi:hypothetical protein
MRKTIFSNMTAIRYDHPAAAADLDAPAARFAFDNRLAFELRRLAARFQADCLIHPHSNAWALLKAGEQKAPGVLRHAGRHPQRQSR